jgi:putative ABC transport system substrate-binding protein
MKKKSPFHLLILISTFLVLILWFCAEKKSKTYTVGVINIVPDLDQTFEGFKEGMKELGYREGKNIRYLYHGPTREMSRLPGTARKLRDSGVDLVFSLTTPATLAVKKAVAGTKIPVVFADVTDPVGAGIIESMKNPGCNITGIAFGFQEARRLEWLLKIAPNTRRIYVPYNPGDRAPVLALKMIQSAAEKLGVTLLTRKITDRNTLDHAVFNIPAEADAVFLMPDSLLSTRLPDIVAAANRRKLPISGANISAIKSHEILTSYGFDQHSYGKQAARMVDLIFKGTRPAEMPVELTGFYLGINLKVAKKLGLSVPRKILRQANLIVR